MCFQFALWRDSKRNLSLLQLKPRDIQRLGSTLIDFIFFFLLDLKLSTSAFSAKFANCIMRT